MKIPEKYKKLRMAVADAVSCGENVISVTQNAQFITAVTQIRDIITIFQSLNFMDDCKTVVIDSSIIDAIKKAASGNATK